MRRSDSKAMKRAEAGLMAWLMFGCCCGGKASVQTRPSGAVFLEFPSECKAGLCAPRVLQ